MDDKKEHVPDIHDGDMIYRQAAIDTFKRYDNFGYVEESIETLEKAINQLPPAEITSKDVEAYCYSRCLRIVTAEMMEELKRGYDAPKMKIGYWLVGPDEHGRMCGICSNCKHRQYAGTSPHCPYCGSKNTEVKKID